MLPNELIYSSSKLHQTSVISVIKIENPTQKPCRRVYSTKKNSLEKPCSQIGDAGEDLAISHYGNRVRTRSIKWDTSLVLERKFGHWQWAWRWWVWISRSSPKLRQRKGFTRKFIETQDFRISVVVDRNGRAFDSVGIEICRWRCTRGGHWRGEWKWWRAFS